MSNTRANWQLALVCGKRRVNLLSDPNEGGWSLAYGGASFIPPSATVHYGGHLLRGGQTRVGHSMQNAHFTLKCNLLKQSGLGVLQKNIHEVQKFMIDAWVRNEVGAQDKVYLVRRLDEGYSGTGTDVVLYGRGDLYHEILSVDIIDLTEEAYTGLLSTNTIAAIANVEIVLTCLPFGVGRIVTAAEATGWIRPGDDGQIEIYNAGSNLFRNCDFEYSGGFSASWNSNSANLSSALATDYVHTGFQAVRLVNSDPSSSRLWSQTLTLTASTYNISCYVYAGGNTISASDCFLWGQGASVATTYTEESGSTRWYRLSGSFTGAAVSSSHGLAIQTAKSLNVDSFQLSPCAWLAPYMLEGYVPGPGVSWDGTEHASQLTRAKGVFRQETQFQGHSGFETAYYGKGAFSCWVRTPWSGNDGFIHNLFRTYSSEYINDLQIAKGTANDLVVNMWGANGGLRQLTISSLTATKWPANTWMFILATWDATGPTALYLMHSGSTFSDTEVATSGSWVNFSSFGTDWFLGSASGFNQWNGEIADVRIFGPGATIDASALYNAGRGKSELGFLWKNSLAGSLSSACWSSSYNWMYAANIPGDMPQPLRLFVTNDGAWESMWLSVNNSLVFPYRLNTVKLSASSMTDYSGSQITNASRVDGYHMSDVTPTLFIERVIRDGRQMEFVQGRYRILGISEDQNSLGVVGFRANLAHNAPSGLSAVSVHNGYRFGDFVYAAAQSDFKVFDYGVFNVPIYGKRSMPLDQERLRISSISASKVPLSICISPCGGTITTRHDYVQMMSEDGLMKLHCSTPVDIIVDGFTQQAYANATAEISSSMTMEPIDTAITFYGEWPIVPPYAWSFINILTDQDGTDQSPSAGGYITAQYQPSYYWSR